MDSERGAGGLAEDDGGRARPAGGIIRDRGPAAPGCRSCGAVLGVSMLDLGYAPLARNLVPMDRAGMPETRYPLHLRACGRCWLAQTDAVLSRRELFPPDHPRLSSMSESRVAAAHRFAAALQADFDLPRDRPVIELGSNDGYLLRWFVRAGYPVLGIDPSARAGLAAALQGVPTLTEFFDADLGRRLHREGRRPSLVLALGLLNRVPDPLGFLGGVAALIDDAAVFAAEVPHLLPLCIGGRFERVHHEHQSILSLVAAERLFARAGLRVFDATTTPAGGGTLRLLACRDGAPRDPAPGLGVLRAREIDAGMEDAATLAGLMRKAEQIRAGLMDFLTQAQDAGRLVAAYGAGASGSTLLNWCAIGPDLVAFCADRNPAKQNKLMAGSRIPVLAPECLDDCRPDYVLILPADQQPEIMAQLSPLRTRGTQFVLAAPALTILA